MSPCSTPPNTRSTQVYIQPRHTPPATISSPVSRPSARSSKAMDVVENVTAVTENTPAADASLATRIRYSRAQRLSRSRISKLGQTHPPLVNEIELADETATAIIANIQFNMKILVIDIAYEHHSRIERQTRSYQIPPVQHDCRADDEDVLAATKGWEYDCISSAYPGPVSMDRASRRSITTCAGWIDSAEGPRQASPLHQRWPPCRPRRLKVVACFFLGIGTVSGCHDLRRVSSPLNLPHLPTEKGPHLRRHVGLRGHRTSRR